MLDIAKGRGLTAYGEAFASIEIHSMMFFKYSECSRELKKLYDEIKDITFETKI